MADIYNRDGGPFLDQIEVEQREIKSARIEGREPDFSVKNLAPTHDSMPTELKEKLEKAAEETKDAPNEPVSLTPEVFNPVSPDSSVTPENVNVPVPSVITADTVVSDPPFVPAETDNEEIDDDIPVL